MKPFIRLACLALCAGLLLAASACSQQDSSPGFHRFRKFCGKRSHAYAGAHRSPTPEPSTPTPAPTPSPEPESSPAAGDFEAAFADNPIDAQLEEDLSFASSNALVQQAYSSAVDRWETLIQTAYAQAEEDLSPEGFSTLQAEQEAWEQGRGQRPVPPHPEQRRPLAAASGHRRVLPRLGPGSCARPSTMPPASCPSFPEIDAGPRAKSLYFPPGKARAACPPPPQTPPPQSGVRDLSRPVTGPERKKTPSWELFCRRFPQAFTLLWSLRPLPGRRSRALRAGPRPSSAVPSSSISTSSTSSSHGGPGPKVATLLPSWSFITRTPLLGRAHTRTLLAAMRMMTPSSEMRMMSSSMSTTLMAATRPNFSVW